jgi:hypothetical protein
MTRNSNTKFHTNVYKPIREKKLLVGDALFWFTLYQNKSGNYRFKVKKILKISDKEYIHSNITLDWEDSIYFAQKLLSFMWELQAQMSGIELTTPNLTSIVFTDPKLFIKDQSKSETVSDTVKDEANNTNVAATFIPKDKTTAEITERCPTSLIKKEKQND